MMYQNESHTYLPAQTWPIMHLKDTQAEGKKAKNTQAKPIQPFLSGGLSNRAFDPRTTCNSISLRQPALCVSRGQTEDKLGILPVFSRTVKAQAVVRCMHLKEPLIRFDFPISRERKHGSSV